MAPGDAASNIVLLAGALFAIGGWSLLAGVLGSWRRSGEEK
jgi:hypothetical protein